MICVIRGVHAYYFAISCNLLCCASRSTSVLLYLYCHLISFIIIIIIFEDVWVYLAVFLFLLSAFLDEMASSSRDRNMRAAADLCTMQSWSTQDITDRILSEVLQKQGIAVSFICEGGRFGGPSDSNNSGKEDQSTERS